MTFFGIPILAQFLAAVIAMLGVGLAGIIEVCNIFITPTIYLLLNIFMLALNTMHSERNRQTSAPRWGIIKKRTLKKVRFCYVS